MSSVRAYSLHEWHLRTSLGLRVTQAAFDPDRAVPSPSPPAFAASLVLNGGSLETFIGINESLASLSATGSSVISFFPGWASTLSFGSLALGDELAIWNYSDDDFITIASGTAAGSLSQVAFDSDSGSTSLGYGGFESTRLVPVAVPEPSTIAMALTGLAADGILRRRPKRAASLRASSPS